MLSTTVVSRSANVYYGLKRFGKHTHIFNKITNFCKSTAVFVRVGKVLIRFDERNTPFLSQISKSCNLNSNFDNEGLHSLQLFTKHQTAALQGIARNSSKTCEFMDGEENSSPHFVELVRLHHLFKVCSNNASTLIKPSSYIDPFLPTRVRIGWALPSHILNEVLLVIGNRYEQFQVILKRIGTFQVEQLHINIELVGTALRPDEHTHGCVL